MSFESDREQVRAALVAAFSRRGINAKDLAFHLTDWLEDLQSFVEVLSRPDAYSKEQIRRRVIGFVIHASGHLSSANEILLGDGDESEKPAKSEPRS